MLRFHFLQSESSAVADVVENQTVANMPLIDRRSAQLQRLSGFVVGNNSGANVSFAVGGGRGNNANYLIDGGTVQDLLLGVPILIFDPPITFGNAPRTFGRGPALVITDASLLKDFKILESTTLQFRAEALNVFNHANLANPNTLFGNGAFGQISGLQAGNQSRIIQLALHLTF
jgi:hypothetical protein